MQFACSQCNARFQIADAKVGPRGVKVPCKRCGHTIIVKRNAEAEPSPDVPIFILPPSLAHLAQPAAGPAPRPPEEGESTQVLDNPLAQQAEADQALALATPPGTAAVTDDDERTSVEAPRPAPPKSPPEQAADPAEVLRAAAAAELAIATLPPSMALGEEGEEGRQSTRVMTGLESEQLVSASAQGDEEPLPAAPAPAPAPAAVDWYVGVDDQQVGPLRVDQLVEKWQAGAIGPDTLCWRAGMDDWLPVSRVAELSAVLSPRPPPAVVAAPPQPPSPPSQSVTRVTGSFVSMASTGVYEPLGATGSNRPFTDVPGAAAVPAPVAVTVAPPVDTGGWRPSAASALASLVREEMAVLSRPQPPAPAPTGPSDAFGFGEGTPHGGTKLEVPLSEARAGAVYGSPDVDPFAATSPGFSYKSPSQSAPPRAPLPASGWMPPGAPVTAVPPPPAPARNTMAVLFGALGVAILVALGVIVWLLVRQQAAPAPGTEMAAAPAPRPAEVAAPAAAAPKSAPEPVAAASAAEPKPEPKTEARADVPAEKPVAASPEPRAEKKPAERPAERPVEKRATEKPAERPVKEKVVAAPPPPPREEKRPVAKAPAVAEDDFDSIFGAPKKKETAPPPEDKAAKKTVYVPPPPAASAEPERLTQADINGVVVTNKSSIKGCVDEQKAKDPSLKGKLVMRWTIQTSGKVTGVGCQTEQFKDSAMAGCLSRLIKGLQFPRHRVQGDPVNFTFTF
ncbi:MAG: zinc-ribbon domain-containing protein [Deltaproteobacteria bacterium]|nr:zinc-ribbon domain-containing protein [Deltaproteobacteria bacterium]